MKRKKVYVQRGRKILDVVTLKINGKYRVDTYELKSVDDDQDYETCNDDYYASNGFNRLNEGD